METASDRARSPRIMITSLVKPASWFTMLTADVIHSMTRILYSSPDRMRIIQSRQEGQNKYSMIRNARGEIQRVIQTGVILAALIIPVQKAGALSLIISPCLH